MSSWSPGDHDSATTYRSLIPHLFSVLCTLVYKHFREVPSCSNFPETVWKLSSSFCLVGCSLFIWICLGRSSISPVLLITRSMLFTPHILFAHRDLHFLTWLLVILSLPPGCSFKALLASLATLLKKMVFLHLVRWLPCLPSKLLLLKRTI